MSAPSIQPRTKRRVLIDPENVRQLASEGLVAYRIGKVLGFSDGAVAKCAIRHGIVVRKGRRSVTSPLWREKTDALIEKFEAGTLSISAIARDLGVTKNQAIGRLSRLGRIGQRHARKRKNPYLEFPPPGHCVYPYGGERERPTGFCGEQARFGSPYCEHHHHVCHLPPPKSKDGANDNS